jgi:MraZ protein
MPAPPTLSLDLIEVKAKAPKADEKKAPAPLSAGTAPTPPPLPGPDDKKAPAPPPVGEALAPPSPVSPLLSGADAPPLPSSPPPGLGVPAEPKKDAPKEKPPAVPGDLRFTGTAPVKPMPPAPSEPAGVTPPVPSADWSRPTPAAAPAAVEAKPMPGEPPLAPTPGPVQSYFTRGGETMKDIAVRTMGSAERCADIHRLNPTLKPEVVLAAGTSVRLPGDACVVADEEAIRPLPAMHPKAAPAKPKAVPPLTGTYPANLDDKKAMTLPAGMREQLGNVELLLVSPGPDQCLWLTNQAHLDRLAQRLEHSPAREVEVRVFKRLYFAQTEKAPLTSEGRLTIPDRLAQFAGLHQEVVLVGIDDHFELWDAARWRSYTQQKSASTRTGGADSE